MRWAVNYRPQPVAESSDLLHRRLSEGGAADGGLSKPTLIEVASPWTRASAKQDVEQSEVLLVDVSQFVSLSERALGRWRKTRDGNAVQRALNSEIGMPGPVD